MEFLIFTKKEIDYLCEKYDIVGHSPSKDDDAYSYYYLFIRSQLFNPDGWKRVFNDGYYNSFVKFKYIGFNRYKFWKVSYRPDVPDMYGYYVFSSDRGPGYKFSSKKEIEDWINETCLYIRNELPLIAKRNIVKNKREELDKDFVCLLNN